MRYKCVGYPHCLKTFEYGHALRAHIAACETAQKVLKAKSAVERLENDISLEYPGIHGLHLNQHYPISHGLDRTSKAHFVDRFGLTGGNGENKQPPRRLIKQVKSNPLAGQDSSRVKSLISYSGN